MPANVDALQSAKQVVRRHTATFDSALKESECKALDVLLANTASTYSWRGSYPFSEQTSAAAAISAFWAPLRTSLQPLQRREDVFLAGHNDVNGREGEVWVCSMGHFLGLFDRNFLGIPPTGRMAFLRYVEFSQVENGLLIQSCLHCDVIGLMVQAGANVYPLPPPAGAHIFPHPGPRTHAGLLFDPQPENEGIRTLALCNQMCDDLSNLNELSKVTGSDEVPVELMAQSWHDDMLWYGPGGTGSTYTIERYLEQHSLPFRRGLADKRFNGHVARIAEGEFCAWFGWPNLSNRLNGGYLGLPEGKQEGEMRVVGALRDYA